MNFLNGTNRNKHRGKPVPETPPDPPPTGPQSYMLSTNGQWTGSRRRLYNRALSLSWENLNGDWLDKNGTKQGTVPWHQVVVPINSVGYISTNVFELVQHWITTGKNKGAFLFCPSTNSANAFAIFQSTTNTNPPKLDITTTVGSWSLTGDVAGWTETSDLGTNTATLVTVRRSTRALLHFPDLEDVTGTLTGATLRLYANQSDDIFPLTINLYEIDAPALNLGTGGRTVTLGLAASVGEANLPSHPSVYAAGDMRRTNLWVPALDANTSEQNMATITNPAGVFNHASAHIGNRNNASFISDPDAPGTTYARLAFVPAGTNGTGGLGHGELGSYVGSRADTTDPLRPCIPMEELYARIYLRFEEGFYSEDTGAGSGGLKFGLGFDARLGVWSDSNQGWINAAGSAQTPSNGKKIKWFRRAADPIAEAEEDDIWQNNANATFRLTGGVWVTDNKYNDVKNANPVPVESARWLYEGHSMRMHTGFESGGKIALGNKYPEVYALCNAPSHLGNPPGTYDTAWEGGKFGTEQTLRMGLGVHAKEGPTFMSGVWYCLEAYIKMNSINFSNPDAYGNGTPNNDGILRYWIDGALVADRTNFAWRCHPEMGVEGTWLVHYHGGTEPCARLFYWNYNHYVVASEYIGPNPDRL